MDVADPEAASTRRRPRRVLVVAAITLLVVVAAVILTWRFTRTVTVRTCTATAAIGNPVTSSPSSAVDAWWAQRGPQDAQHWSSSDGLTKPYPVSRSDFVQVGDTGWEWRYRDNKAVDINVGHPPGNTATDAWTVIAVNGCTLGDT